MEFVTLRVDEVYENKVGQDELPEVSNPILAQPLCPE